MDYSKLFRKEMPLAVPHQKPPSKYASRLYPFYEIDSYQSDQMMANSVLIRPWFSDVLEPYQAMQMTADSIVITQILFPQIDITLPTQYENYKAGQIVVDNVVITQVLNPSGNIDLQTMDMYAVNPMIVNSVSIKSKNITHVQKESYAASKMTATSVRIYEV